MREICMLRSTRRGLETWHGRDGVTLADERARQRGTQTRPKPARQSSTLLIGGIEETSASFEARSAPRSYPTSHSPTWRPASSCSRLTQLRPIEASSSRRAEPALLNRRAGGRRHGGVDARHRVLPVVSSCDCTGIITCSLGLPGNMT